MTVSGVVGRDAELARARAFLDSILLEPGALLAEGEAGIGKTTVWAAAIGEAESRGIRVLQARAAETEVQLSYATLADLVGDKFEEARRTLPPIQQRALGAALLRAESDEPAQPRTVATAFVGVLAALAESTPVLVAIDDVQWLDPASADALAFAARRLPAGVGLLLTRRGDPAELPPLGLERALPEGRLERLRPGPLSLAALHHLLLDRLGAAPPRPALARLAEASDGNPFLALEIARALALDWSVLAGGGPLPVPRDLQEIARERVEGLSAQGRNASLVAAALSRPTRDLILRAVAPEDPDASGLLEAEEAGVLVAEADRVRFTHPLLASAIYGAASSERRRRLHERLAEVASDPEERARHLALSTDDQDEAVAAELEQAAARAARRGAQAAAAELFAGACRLTPDELSEERARRELGQAGALMALGDLQGSRALGEAAAERVSGPLRARALLLLGNIAWIGGDPSAIAKLERALEAAREDSGLLAQIHAKLVNVAVAVDPAGLLDRARAAAEAIDPERDPAPAASVLSDLVWAESLRGHGEQKELLERWRACEERAGPDAPKTLFALIYFRCVDDAEAARSRYAIEERWYRERGEDVWSAERLSHICRVELDRGNWDAAERGTEAACEVMAQPETPGPWVASFRNRALVDAHRGRIERALATFGAEGEGLLWWEALRLSGLALVHDAAGNHAEVDSLLTRMHELTDSVGIRDFIPDRGEPIHVEALVALGQLERAREELARLEERGRVFPRLWITVALPRARALVLGAEGDVAGALAALAELDVEAAATLPLEHGRALLVRGRLLRRQKQKRAAADTLREALAIFERLGAPAWEAQARAELDRVGLRRSPDELTATERRVAELAATGLTNREVASKAFMSPKTVQANLTRIYRKLGIGSRAELGARMAEERRQATPAGARVRAESQRPEQVVAEAGELPTPVRRSVPTDRMLATILFTDLVGSTEKAQALGDAAWSDLVARHHDAVRRQLRHFSGEEVDTAGDGFLALFDGPARAIGCAVAIRESLSALGLEVRAGVHTGEVEWKPGDKPRGIAVHLAARVMAGAAAGEVLVSRTTADLVAGSGLELEDRGEQALKGIESPFRVLAVRG
jgi:class 3 adenylate cyclase